MGTKNSPPRKSFDEPKTGSILIKLADGSRNSLPAKTRWSAMIHDGRSPEEWQRLDVPGAGSAEIVKGLRYFDNLFDAYTVLVSADGYESAGWLPVHLSPSGPVTVELMLLQKDSHLNFSGASWESLKAHRPRYAEILSIGCDDPRTRYRNLADQSEGLLLACILNLLTAMSQIVLPSKRSPIEYYWEPIWESSEFSMAQDRFYAYVDEALVDDVIQAGKLGAFTKENDPKAFHSGATLSYKQVQFDVTNVQLTFHQNNRRTRHRFL
jgi:hypothetical protein